MSQYDGKVFGIGFYKTGTTSLFEALRVLGYDTVNGDTPGSYPGADDGITLIRQIDAGDFHLPTFEMFDAFTDNPYFRIWREIHAMYPEARYILTTRDEESWIASCTSFYRNRRIRPMRASTTLEAGSSNSSQQCSSSSWRVTTRPRQKQAPPPEFVTTVV